MSTSKEVYAGLDNSPNKSNQAKVETVNSDGPRTELDKPYKSMRLRSDTKINVNPKRKEEIFVNVKEFERNKNFKPRTKYSDTKSKLPDRKVKLKYTQKPVDQTNYGESLQPIDNKLTHTEGKRDIGGRHAVLEKRKTKEPLSKLCCSPRSPIKSSHSFESASCSKSKALKLEKLNPSNNVDDSEDADFETKVQKLRIITTKRKLYTSPNSHEIKSTTMPLQKNRTKVPTSSENCTSFHNDLSLPVTKRTTENVRERKIKEKLRMETNLKINEVLEKLAKPPEKVDILTIKNLSRNKILNSFYKYKPILDECFKKNSKNLQIKGYKGINHYTVMSLVDHESQLDMMNKLRDVYESAGELTSTYVTLYANAMMPEWIISLFMDEHKLTREQAINQINAQEAYRLHLEAENSKINFNLCVDN